MRLVRFAVKLRMKLAGDEKGMFCQFDDFNQFAIWSESAEDETRILKPFAIVVVELVTVAMPFVHNESSVKTRGFGAND